MKCNFTFKIGLNVLGVVENMSQLHIPLSSLASTENSNNNTIITNSDGENVTNVVIDRLV